MGNLESPVRDVDTDDLGKRRILEKGGDQLATAAADIQNPRRA